MLRHFAKAIHDLDEDGFADMFDQTILWAVGGTYFPTFWRACRRQSGRYGAQDKPILRELFSTFLSLGGRDKHKAMDFDELGIRDVVNMLRSANMGAVLRTSEIERQERSHIIHFL